MDSLPRYLGTMTTNTSSRETRNTRVQFWVQFWVQFSVQFWVQLQSATHGRAFAIWY